MANVTSRDGTKIAYEVTGRGPAVIFVNGAMAFRDFYGNRDLANELSEDFTVFLYDRRGRGESTNTHPYDVDREIDDIEALIDEAGGSAYVYGVSSGAALALLAAARLGPSEVSRLALYEPPYGSDDEASLKAFADERKTINDLVAAGKPGDAVAAFIGSMGTPPDVLEGMKQTPDWGFMEGVGHTLVYDFAVLGDGAVPLQLAKSVAIPTLVMDGGESFDFMHEAADTLSRALPNAERKTLEGQTHEVSAESLAPLLIEFFKR